MKKQSWTRREFRKLAGAGALLFGACFIALPATQAQTNTPAKSPATDTPATADVPDYANWLELGVGGSAVQGDKAQYEHQSGLPGNTAFGGVKAFHFEEVLGKKGLFSVDGRGILDNHDYDLKLEVQHPEIGYVTGGFRQYREYYDGTGGFLPSNGLSFPPPNQELTLDRGQAFIEGALTLPNWPVLKLRYEHDYRSGAVDSTEWGTTTLTGPGQANNTGTLGQKKIAPAFRTIDEKTDTLFADLSHTLGNTDLGVGLRADWIRNTDSQNISFFPNQVNAQGDAHTLTQTDGNNNNIFNVHAFTDTKLNDKVEFSTGYSYTTMQDQIFGSRLDNPNVAVGADTRYANLAGVSDMEQYEMNANFMYTPIESLYIVPAVRVEEEDLAGGSSDNAVTGAGVIGAVTTQQDNEARLNLAQSIDVRYTGVTNWSFYVRGDWEQNRANMNLLQANPPAAPSTVLTNDWHQGVQKYTIGANWYPLRGLNLAAQYYHKFDDNNYENVTPTPTAYPGFIAEQNFNVDDVNFRVTCRPLSQLTLVSRYDFKYSTVTMQGFGLGTIESGNTTTHMFGESVSWTPFNRVYLELGANYVLDTTHTPADTLNEAPIAGIPISGVIQSSKNDYYTVNAMLGYAINDKTQVSLNYVYYRSSDYSDNSTIGLPYGAGGEQHSVTTTLTRQITQKIKWALQYSFASYRDDLFGGNLDYTAHTILSSVQYRF